MTRYRRRRLLALVAAASVALTACAGLPTTGDPRQGLPMDEVDTPREITELASGPAAGAGPEEIVEGFMDAAITSTDGWATARLFFLSPELANTWKPSAGVTIDTSAAERTFTSDVDDVDESAEVDEGEVRVMLNQVARVDENAAYTQLSGDAALATFEVARNDDGEWRIVQAQDGIVLDAEAFPQVFRRHALQYYDPAWARLVPDVRWYPRRATIATTLTQALLGGQPSEWLAPAVRSAFPSDVDLVRDAVPLVGGVAEVELTSEALGLDATTLARMRTQLEETLKPAGVSEVRFTVNGRDLNAGRATVQTTTEDSGTLVLTETAFGALVGDEITRFPGISEEVIEVGSDVRAIDVAVDHGRAAMQLGNGIVYSVGDGGVNELDARPGLVRPSMDPFGYIWTVPASDPQALKAWEADVTSRDIANAFPEASEISQVRVAADGVRLAAVVTIGGQHWVIVAAIIRDENGVPIELGPMRMIAQLGGSGVGLSWVGDGSLGILTEDEGSRMLVTQDVGGPATVSAAPENAQSIAGARTAGGVRLLDGDGVLYAQRGITWQQAMSGVLVLGTHAGQ